MSEGVWYRLIPAGPGPIPVELGSGQLAAAALCAHDWVISACQADAGHRTSLICPSPPLPPPQPVLTFDLGSPVGDAAWAPYSSTVFAAATEAGRLAVFDLEQDAHAPCCMQKARAGLPCIVVGGVGWSGGDQGRSVPHQPGGCARLAWAGLRAKRVPAANMQPACPAAEQQGQAQQAGLQPSPPNYLGRRRQVRQCWPLLHTPCFLGGRAVVSTTSFTCQGPLLRALLALSAHHLPDRRTHAAGAW